MDTETDATLTATRPARILVVDDEAMLTDLLAELLEDEGYVVERAYNGEQALQQMRSDGPPDLVLSDVMMPRMTGTELVAYVRRHLSLARPPVLLLSAGPEPRIEWDNVAFMPKPLHFEGLLEQVQRLLDLAHGHAQTTNAAA